MDFHTKSCKSPDPEVPIQSLYICINRVTQTVSLGCLWLAEHILRIRYNMSMERSKTENKVIEQS